MAIPTFVSIGTAAGGTDSVTPGAPAGSVTDDIWLLHIEGEGEDADPDGGPSGWTIIDSVASAIDGAADRVRCTMYWLRYDSGSPPSRVVPDAGNHTLAYITAWSGCITTESPIHKSQTSSSSTNDTSVSATGVSTDVADCMIVITTAAGDNVGYTTWANSNLADPAITVADVQTTSAGSDGMIGVAYGGLASAGASGTTTCTCTALEEEANIVIALKPPAGAGGISIPVVMNHLRNQGIA